MTFSTLKRGGPLKQRSDKRVKEDAAFAKVRRFVMARDRGCQFPHTAERLAGWGIDRCAGPLDPHHVVPVARDSTLRLDLNNLAVLCRKAHSWVHDHPAEATELGLLASPQRNPRTHPAAREGYGA